MQSLLGISLPEDLPGISRGAVWRWFRQNESMLVSGMEGIRSAVGRTREGELASIQHDSTPSLLKYHFDLGVFSYHVRFSASGSRSEEEIPGSGRGSEVGTIDWRTRQYLRLNELAAFGGCEKSCLSPALWKLFRNAFRRLMAGYRPVKDPVQGQNKSMSGCLCDYHEWVDY